MGREPDRRSRRGAGDHRSAGAARPKLSAHSLRRGGLCPHRMEHLVLPRSRVPAVSARLRRCPTAPDGRGAVAPRQERLRHEQQRRAQRRPAGRPKRRQMGAAVGRQLLPHRSRLGRDSRRGAGAALSASISSFRWRARSRTPTCWRRAIGQASSTSRKSCSAATRGEEFDPALCLWPPAEGIAALAPRGVRADGTIGRWRPGIRPSPSCRPEAHQFASCGWVNRLESGQQALEGNDRVARKDRGQARISAHRGVAGSPGRAEHAPAPRPRAADALSRAVAGSVAGPAGETGRCDEIVAAIEAEASAAIARGTFSVLDKTGCAPSGDRRDYWHPAPYWWPNPDSPDGLPYIQRDGQRRPGTNLYEPGSEEFDRSNLQRVLEGATVCALAWRATGKQPYADHGAALIRRWFVDPESRMNPHLEFAQARMGPKSYDGQPGRNHRDARPCHIARRGKDSGARRRLFGRGPDGFRSMAPCVPRLAARQPARP